MVPKVTLTATQKGFLAILIMSIQRDLFYHGLVDIPKHMEVSINGCTPKWMVFVREKPSINGCCGGTPMT